MASPTGRAGQAPRVYRSPSLDSPYRISSASTTNICIPVFCAQQPPMMVSASLYARHLEKEIVLTRYDFSGSTINLSIAEDSRDVNVTCNVSLAEVTDISRFIRHRLALVFGRSPANGNPRKSESMEAYASFPRLFHRHDISALASPASSSPLLHPTRQTQSQINKYLHASTASVAGIRPQNPSYTFLPPYEGRRNLLSSPISSQTRARILAMTCRSPVAEEMGEGSFREYDVVTFHAKQTDTSTWHPALNFQPF
jgi:hypothetical protein